MVDIMQDKNSTLILASNSPRRKELLAREGVEYEVVPADIEEVTDRTIPCEVVMELSRMKAEAVAMQHPGRSILAADTIVTIDGMILGKPADEEDALNMLSRLSGRRHQVYTGVALVFPDGRMENFFECTDVEMYENDEATLREYIATGEPMDKAGAYAIQGIGAKLVKQIHGDYDNVVGLPVRAVLARLSES